MSLADYINDFKNSTPEKRKELSELFRQMIKLPENRYLVFQILGDSLTGPQISRMQRMSTVTQVIA